MTWIFGGMTLFSIIFGMLNGKVAQVSLAAFEESGKSVTLIISLTGVMCLWSGLMNIAEKSGLTEKFSRFFSPVLRLLFRGMKPESPAAKAISMNISANLLGLGNAATPLGISAMHELEAMNQNPSIASNDMITFVVLNTASLQLIPTTTAALRLQAGSTSPLDILPAVWVVSLVSVVTAVLLSFLLRSAPSHGRLPAAQTRLQSRGTHL